MDKMALMLIFVFQYMFYISLKYTFGMNIKDILIKIQI